MCTLYIGKSKGRNKGFGSFYTYNIHVCNTCLSENRGKTELQDWKHNAYIYEISTHGETTKTARQQLLQFLQPEILKILDSIPGFASQFTIQRKDRKVWKNLEHRSERTWRLTQPDEYGPRQRFIKIVCVHFYITYVCTLYTSKQQIHFKTCGMELHTYNIYNVYIYTIYVQLNMLWSSGKTEL